jgi:hypothetical protein
MERVFGALRQRLPPELHRAGMRAGIAIEDAQSRWFFVRSALAYW